MPLCEWRSARVYPGRSERSLAPTERTRGSSAASSWSGSSPATMAFDGSKFTPNMGDSILSRIWRKLELDRANSG
jgi:hypothetical protein